MSLTADTRIVKVGEPEELERQVAQALIDIEANVQQLKSQLSELVINSAKSVSLPDGTTCVLVFVPQPQLKKYHTVQTRLVDELCKNLHVDNVLIIAQRKILPKETRKNRVKKQQRPRSRTLTNVHEAILDDLVYPAQITGKSTRHRVEGGKILKVKLAGKSKDDVQEKLDTFAYVYKRLTGKDADFTF
eukprot:TRINITY_DN3767_c0_g1_i1.p1 TRINITY_DN3767_c0_g1~~TRINITY_DN3767_c0_g1_i1.p1  ORF type:complete len:189 (+),score=55.59 TRINITY_DN3767_c0_g1_i1:84-650(+)